jgi:hypothetical protein
MSGTFKKGIFQTEIVDQNAADNCLVDSDGDTSETRSKAEEAESKLNEAIHLMEKRTGGLLVFQQATQEDIVELGRQLPNLSAEHSLNDDGGSVNSVGSLYSEPFFVKATGCHPSLLRQLSWEAMPDTSKWEAMSDTSKNDTENETILHLPQKEKEEKQRFKERKWDKLRNTADARPEKEKENSDPDDRNARDFRRRLSFFRRKPPSKNQTRKLDEEGNRLIVRTGTRNQTTIKKTSGNHCCDPAGESLEVVAYSSSEGKFHVLPPFPSKMI